MHPNASLGCIHIPTYLIEAQSSIQVLTTNKSVLMFDILKLLIVVAIAFFLLGFVFSILFKVGFFLLILMGVIYMFDRVFGSKE